MGCQVRVILQARTTSSRLPGKSLLPIAGLPLAGLCAMRLGSTGHDVVVATSSDTSDDFLAESLGKLGLNVFRGDLKNVLNRFLKCSVDLSDEDLIVRTTADNPLPDGEFIDDLLDLFHEAKNDYFGTSSPDDGLPFGLSAEVFTVAALRKAAVEATDPLVFEHVTTSMRSNASKAGVVRKFFLRGVDLSHLRVTVDTLDDYLAMARLFNEVESPLRAGWKTFISKLSLERIVGDKLPYRQQGGKKYSLIMLGTVQIGLKYGITNNTGRPNDEEVTDILKYAVANGITHLDTARAYGDSESRIGKLMPLNDKLNARVITKLQPLDFLADTVSDQEVASAVDLSVYRSCYELRLEHLDVVMFHRSQDMFRFQSRAMIRLSQLVDNGLISELGVSVYTPDEAIQCLSDLRIKHLQIPFNLIDGRWLQREFSEAIARRVDVCIHVRSIFLQGLLINEADLWPDWVDNRRKLVDSIETMVNDYNRKNKADLCLAYVRSFPWVTSIVIGVETLEQLQDIVRLVAEPPLTLKQLSLVPLRFEGMQDRLLNPPLWTN